MYSLCSNMMNNDDNIIGEGGGEEMIVNVAIVMIVPIKNAYKMK